MTYMNYDDKIIRSWRTNARITFTELAHQTNTPVSTTFMRWKRLEQWLQPHYTTLINPSQWNHPITAWFIITTVAPIKTILAHPNINNAYKTPNGYLIEYIAKNMAELAVFEEQITHQYQLVHVLQTLKTESFLSETKKS